MERPTVSFPDGSGANGAEDRGPGSAGRWLDSDWRGAKEYFCMCLCVYLCVTERDRQTDNGGNPIIRIRLPLLCKEVTDFSKP